MLCMETLKFLSEINEYPFFSQAQFAKSGCFNSLHYTRRLKSETLLQAFVFVVDFI